MSVLCCIVFILLNIIVYSEEKPSNSLHQQKIYAHHSKNAFIEITISKDQSFNKHPIDRVKQNDTNYERFVYQYEPIKRIYVTILLKLHLRNNDGNHLIQNYTYRINQILRKHDLFQISQSEPTKSISGISFLRSTIITGIVGFILVCLFILICLGFCYSYSEEQPVNNRYNQYSTNEVKDVVNNADVYPAENNRYNKHSINKVKDWLEGVDVYPDSPESLHVNISEGDYDDNSSDFHRSVSKG